MSDSTSSPTNTTSTTTNAKETNVSLQGGAGAGGPVITCSAGTTVTVNNVSSDLGAVQAGTTLGALAIAKNTGLSQSVATGAQTFACHAIDVLSSEQTQSANLASSFLAAGQSLIQQQQSFLSCVQQSGSKQLANYATTLSNIATANDTSNASQSTAFATNTLEIAAVAAVAIILIIAFARD